MWQSVINPPVFVDKDYCLQSDAVLVYRLDGCICTARYEQYYEDEPPRWTTADSEGWDITNLVTHWQHLPPPPDKS